MSAIRVVYGSAEVEVTSDDFVYHSGEVLARYQPRDLLRATTQALRAMDDPQATKYADALCNGLDREGLEL